MSAYYNEFDRNAARWLRELIAAGEISDGFVDDRSITDVRAADIGDAERVHLFAGIGGWDYALRLAGWPVDKKIMTLSCPCQPFSLAGKLKGSDDERHLLPAALRLIESLKTPTIIGEQVTNAIRMGWMDELCDALESLGYELAFCTIPAAAVGAPHIRQRLWWVASLDTSR